MWTSFVLFLGRILPLYLLVGAGFVAGRWMGVRKEPVGALLFYFIVPVIVFNGVACSPLSAATLALPVLFFLMSSTLALVADRAIGTRFDAKARGAAAFACGATNSAFFGIPAALALIGPQAAGPATLIPVGYFLFENSVGFYLVARGQATAREALIRMAKLPTLHAFVLGLIAAAAGFSGAWQPYATVLPWFHGAMVVLGMMLIGLGLAGADAVAFDRAFLGITVILRAVAWPLAMLAVVALDARTTNLFDTTARQTLVLMALTPISAGSVTIATVLDAHPERVAVAVMASTLLALITLPLGLAAVLGAIG